MNINEVIEYYDNMFSNHSIEEIEAYLMDQIKAAMEEEDDGALITLLNEIIGLMRDTFQKEKAFAFCGELKKLIVSFGLTGTEAEATSYQNIANAYRAFGKYEESLSYFKMVEASYEKFLNQGDYRYASLYNNWGLLYQEMQEWEEAVSVLKKSLAIIDAMPEYVEARATTRINLANSLIPLVEKALKTGDAKKDSLLKEAVSNTEEALELFETDGGRDFHYAAALATMGDLDLIQNEEMKAADFYQRSLLDMEKHLGKDENYLRVYEKFQKIAERNPKVKWKSNLERSQEFYQLYGKKMIEENYAEYADRISVGICGEGSDCFGFDDYISADHDYATGFVMWLTESDYQLFGARLQQDYEKLLSMHALDLKQDAFLDQRRGVKTINGFFGNLLDRAIDFENGEKFSLNEMEEYRLAAAVNGKIFTDRMGKVTEIRNRIFAYYERPYWLKMLAKEIHDFSAYGQSNYSRAMAREDYVTANLCVAKTMEAAMNLIYLLNQRFAPYDKWKMKALSGVSNLQEAVSLLQEAAFLENQKEAWKGKVYQPQLANQEDQYIVLFEKLAALFLAEMKKQNLVAGESIFLESYVSALMADSMKTDLVEAIVALEWRQFDGVKNEGGRASCQDDFSTFSIMRKSQYLTWNSELLESYYADLCEAEARGWNLIMEKYARMMESTSKEQYEELKKQLPERSERRIAIQEEIIKIQINWMEEFAEKYPKMAGNARTIHTSEDTEFSTSYETYLRGELGTYGEETIALYGRMIVNLKNQDKNLAYEIMTNTAHLYGYGSVEEAEGKISV